jgi:hypothetical protein
MIKVFLLMVVSGLLVTLGFAQSPDADSNVAEANVRGCLGGSDGNYTVAEDGTHQILKITISSVDLKSHLGHDVTLIGHKASGAASSGTADNSFAVTELSMISDHCAAVAAAPAVSASPSPETVSPPAAAAAAPAAPAATASPSPETVSPPAANAAAPGATVSPSSDTVIPASADTTPPAATASPSSETVSPRATAATVSPSSASVNTPAADDAQPSQPSARHRRFPATKTPATTAPGATVSPSSDTVIPAAADTTTPAATAITPSETVSPPAAAATTPTATHRSGSLFLLILIAVLVVVLGTLAPLLGRWRKRKMLERTGTPNLSLMNEVRSDRDKPAPPKAA